MVDDGDYQLRLAARIEHFRELGDPDAVDALEWMREQGKCPKLHAPPSSSFSSQPICLAPSFYWYGYLGRHCAYCYELPSLLYNLLDDALRGIGASRYDSLEEAEDALIAAWRKTDPDERRTRGVTSE